MSLTYGSLGVVTVVTAVTTFWEGGLELIVGIQERLVRCVCGVRAKGVLLILVIAVTAVVARTLRHQAILRGQ
jgi:hypothetical protein